MSLWGVIPGTIVQLMAAVFLFMMTAVIGGSVANGTRLSESQTLVLDLSLYVLPASCILSSVIVWVAFACNGSPLAYLWYAMPLLLAILYIFFVLLIG